MPSHFASGATPAPGACLGVTTGSALLRELDPCELVACTEKTYFRPLRNEPGGNSINLCRRGRARRGRVVANQP